MEVIICPATELNSSHKTGYIAQSEQSSIWAYAETVAEVKAVFLEQYGKLPFNWTFKELIAP